MQRAIRIDDDLSVIVTFCETEVVRLTPQGFEEGTETTCSIMQADGYHTLGQGTTLRAQEDCPDPVRAMRQSLERAALSAFPGPYWKDARATLHQALETAIAEQRQGEQDIAEAVVEMMRFFNELQDVREQALSYDIETRPTVAAPNAYHPEPDNYGYGHGV